MGNIHAFTVIRKKFGLKNPRLKARVWAEMGTFERQRLKRALVSVIVALAAAHSFHTTVTRDSSDKVVAAAARLAVQKVARAFSKGGVGAKGRPYIFSDVAVQPCGLFFSMVVQGLPLVQPPS